MHVLHNFFQFVKNANLSWYSLHILLLKSSLTGHNSLHHLGQSFSESPRHQNLVHGVSIIRRHRNHAFWCLQIKNKLEPWSLVHLFQILKKYFFLFSVDRLQNAWFWCLETPARIVQFSAWQWRTIQCENEAMPFCFFDRLQNVYRLNGRLCDQREVCLIANHSPL